nr:hypothetical protein [Tanacetum cinerariifolium]
MVSGKDSSNLLMADNLPKIIWYSTHHVALMKSWLVQKQTALGQTTIGKEISNMFMAVKMVNDVSKLQALVDRKKVIITEATIRDALRLDDADDIEYLPNEEIFTKLARIGYEKPYTKLTFYKLSQECGLPNKVLHVSMISVIDDKGTRCSRVETLLFEGMIVAQPVGKGAAEVNVEDVPAAGVNDEGAASVNDDEVPTAVDEPSIPSPIPSTQPPSKSQDIPSTSQA